MKPPATDLVELPENVAPLQPNGKPVKVELNSGDKLYNEIRDMNFSRVGVLLSQRAKNLSKEYDGWLSCGLSSLNLSTGIRRCRMCVICMCRVCAINIWESCIRVPGILQRT